MKGIESVLKLKFFFWIFKYFIYVTVIYMQTIFQNFDYFTVFIILLEYMLFRRLGFLFKVLLRIEAYKQIYGFEEPSKE